ncbi:hypothetical protein [Budvicia diplopodorum]|uniref:hypothetical protein n=1 Tax=Budvicia diplopodorum TaxID=1119056 RepID=UPI00135B55CA|nr:hypothetical protein [Budvicia diplopodorum]
MDNAALENYLADTLADIAFHQSKRNQLKALGQMLMPFSVLYNCGFGSVSAQLFSVRHYIKPTLMRLAVIIKPHGISGTQPKIASSPHFAQKKCCRNKIRSMLSQTLNGAEIRIFTIVGYGLTESITLLNGSVNRAKSGSQQQSDKPWAQFS